MYMQIYHANPPIGTSARELASEDYTYTYT